MSTFNARVAANTDDTEGSNTASGTLNTDQTIGIRFLSVTIPNAATINSGYITVTIKTNDDDNGDELNVWAEDEDDAATYGDSTTRTYTTALSANFSFGAVTAEAEEVTADIAAPVQEVVDRGGWVSGNDMAFKIAIAAQANEIGFYSHNADPAKAPELDIDYTAVSGPAGVKTINGLAIASVKTLNGLAIASVKTLNASAA